MSAANDMSNEANRLREQAAHAGERIGEEARKVRDQAASSGERMVDDARDELARLKGQVEKLMAERVTPALSDAAERVESYAGQAKQTVTETADALATRVKERPLTALAVAVAGGWLLGRLMTGNTYVYPNRH